MHINLVPMLMPSAPRDKAAAKPCPSAKPPDAMKGIGIVCLARDRRMRFVMRRSDCAMCVGCVCAWEELKTGGN